MEFIAHPKPEFLVVLTDRLRDQMTKMWHEANPGDNSMNYNCSGHTNGIAIVNGEYARDVGNLGRKLRDIFGLPFGVEVLENGGEFPVLDPRVTGIYFNSLDLAMPPSQRELQEAQDYLGTHSYDRRRLEILASQSQIRL